MSNLKYNGSILPNTYGVHYTKEDYRYTQNLVFFYNFIIERFGMLLDTWDRITRKERNVQHNSNMEDPPFVQNMFIYKTIKYSAILYGALVMAMLAVPSGICSSSYHTTAFKYPLIVSHHAAEYTDIALEPLSSTQPEPVTEAPEEAAPSQLEDEIKPPFHGPILRASETYEVDMALIRAIIMAESSNNPRAVSHQGAQGLMQLMPTTAKALGVKDAFDPALNIDGGVRYFKQLLDRFDGNVELALAAYNAGSRYVRKYGGVPPFKETRRYIKKVLKYRKIYQTEMFSLQNRLTMS